MVSFFRKLKRSAGSKAIQSMLEIFYFPPMVPGLNFSPLESIDDGTRTKVMLFTYGVYDAYCQASGISDDQAQQISIELEDYIQSALGASFLEFLNTKTYRDAFEDPDLIKVIQLGGKTYGDFASGDENRGGATITRLRSLVDIWGRMSENKKAPSESKLKLSDLKEALENQFYMVWTGEFLNIRKEMRKDETRYVTKRSWDDHYADIEAYNKRLDMVIDLAKLNIMDNDKRKVLTKLIVEESKPIDGEVNSKIVAYLFIAKEIRERLFSGVFHKCPGILNKMGEELLDLYDDVFSQLLKLKRFEIDDYEEHFEELNKRIGDVGRAVDEIADEPEDAFDTMSE